MNLIRTKSFELAINTKGNENSKKLAIALPGRLDTKDYECFNKHLEYLAGKGFFAVSFDPPGTWESPGDISLFTTTNYIKAVNELIEYFGNKQTLLIGHSRGGTVSILVGASNPHVIAIIPIMATYGEPSPPDPDAIKSGFKISHRDLPPGTTKTKEQKEFALPLNYFKDGQKYNVEEVLKKITKPKLLFYGTNDDFTTPEEVKGVFESLPEPKMLHELNTEHDYRYHSEVVEEINKVIGQFLDIYIINLMEKPTSVDEYITSAPKEVQGKLKELRAAIKEAAPAAEEKISYGMPYYGYKGRLVYFAYAKNHIGIYAIFEPVRAMFREELKGYDMSKGTIRFPLDQKLPLDLVKKLVKAQVKAKLLLTNQSPTNPK